MTKELQNFFIVGCVRSGTTLLRNILREHPKLACPEETHFFRWSWPFRTQRFRFHNTKAKLLKKEQNVLYKVVEVYTGLILATEKLKINRNSVNNNDFFMFIPKIIRRASLMLE